MRRRHPLPSQTWPTPALFSPTSNQGTENARRAEPTQGTLLRLRPESAWVRASHLIGGQSEVLEGPQVPGIKEVRQKAGAEEGQILAFKD